jgi:hypothetical protein
MTLIPLTTTTTTTTRTRDLSNLPDPANPNSHCHSCNFTCASRNNFASHLRRTFNMEIAPLPPKSNTNVVPDPFDPNFFCISSNRKYPTRWKYRHHLNSMHDMNLPPLAKCKKWNANFNCITCSQRFETGRLYLMHLSIMRNMVELSPNLEKKLDTNELRCHICQRTYASLSYLGFHYRRFHPNHCCTIV